MSPLLQNCPNCGSFLAKEPLIIGLFCTFSVTAFPKLSITLSSTMILRSDARSRAVWPLASLKLTSASCSRSNSTTCRWLCLEASHSALPCQRAQRHLRIFIYIHVCIPFIYTHTYISMHTYVKRAASAQRS